MDSALVDEILGKRALHRLGSDEAIKWAETMLLHGFDTPSLLSLALLDDPLPNEVERSLLAVLAELHIPLPEDEVAIRRYACQIAQQIADNTLPAREGVHRLYTIWAALGDDPDYRIWLHLDDALASLLAGVHPFTYEAATLETFDALAQQEAIQFLAKMQN